MDNLVGDEAAAWRDLIGQDGAHLHLYGKAEIRNGRKMGHVTRIFPEKTA
jgi:5-(carboxyamino)imidazole ribonucleotide synthase